MNEEMMKSLVSLIDESLAEIEELKKSDRFSASEVELGDSEGLAGKDKNGKLDKEEEAEKAEEKDEDEDEKDKKDDEAEKAEGVLEEAEKAEDKEEDKKEDDDEDKEEDKEMEKSADESETETLEKSLEKSLEAQETLMKSYIDEKVGGLEGKLAAIATAVQELANSPVPSKGATYKSVQPLAKSEPEVETLNKSQVVEKLFELKKSGEKVETVDIASAELGSSSDLVKIIQKYDIK
jgi:hypothetical protein